MTKDHPPQSARRRYTVLTQLSSQAWEHPTDRAALTALQAEARALLKAVEASGGDRALAHIKAEEGYEHALAAALGEDLDAAIRGEGARRWVGAAIGGGDPALPPGCVSLSNTVTSCRPASSQAQDRPAMPVPTTAMRSGGALDARCWSDSS